MNQDYFEERTDYLSMFTSPDFNNIQKPVADPGYINITVINHWHQNRYRQDLFVIYGWPFVSRSLVVHIPQVRDAIHVIKNESR